AGWAGVFASRLRRAPLVLEIRDLWPESIVAVGAMKGSPLIRLLEWLERRMYAAAREIVTVGDGYRRELEARGVPAERISVIPNGVDGGVFQPRPDDGRLRDEWGLGRRFVCAYVGTIGMGCGLDVALRAAGRLRAEGRDDVRFLLVGDGAVREELEAQARAEGLDAVVFTGRLPKARMPEVLAAADACLVHLTRTPLFQTVLPSKIFEAAGMAKPIVLGVEGFAADLVGRAGAGICIEPENEEQLLEAVTRLAADPALCRKLGEAGLEQLGRPYDWGGLAKTYLAKLEAVGAGASAR
ncbi:MAG TPA: glycosyltransferase family 4 protein, partial [Myxococcota bacterium]|nr:glycosyltransferase family 4 protein [Myxococcota bacterium]